MGRAEAFGAASASSNMRKGAARPTRAKGICQRPRVQVVTWPARRRGVTREDPMNDLTRRDALKAGGTTVAAFLLPSDVVQAAAPTWNGPAPEPGAQLRVLRWKQFVQSEFDSFITNTKKFTDQTGVKIRVDAESWDDIRAKAAVAANVGAGPDWAPTTTRSNSPTSC